MKSAERVLALMQSQGVGFGTLAESGYVAHRAVEFNYEIIGKIIGHTATIASGYSGDSATVVGYCN